MIRFIFFARHRIVSLILVEDTFDSSDVAFQHQLMQKLKASIVFLILNPPQCLVPKLSNLLKNNSITT